MADELTALERMALVQRLLKGIEHETHRGHARHALSDDASSEGVDDER